MEVARRDRRRMRVDGRHGKASRVVDIRALFESSGGKRIQKWSELDLLDIRTYPKGRYDDRGVFRSNKQFGIGTISGSPTHRGFMGAPVCSKTKAASALGSFTGDG